MLTEATEVEQAVSERTTRKVRTATRKQAYGILRSATRPLEVIELFAVHRRPLSVSEIASALEIPQSSSSVLLQAMTGAGFVARDPRSRKYQPSVRSALLGNWVHDVFAGRGGLLEALDELSTAAGASVRIGVRNGVHVQYAHVSWPAGETRRDGPAPGAKMPIGRDALGRMLLLAESEQDVRGIVRHANAVDRDSYPLNVEVLVEDLSRHRREGFAACRDLSGGAGDMLLAIQLTARFGAPAAIGFGIPAERLPGERGRLLALLGAFAAEVWA